MENMTAQQEPLQGVIELEDFLAAYVKALGIRV